MARLLVGGLGLLVLVPLLGLACTSSGDNPGPTPALDAATTDGNVTGDAAPLPPSPGGTGAIGIVVVNGKQKLYLPTQSLNSKQHSYVSVLDVGIAGNGVAGAPALLTNIDLGVEDEPAISAGDSSLVLIASRGTRRVWMIDPQTDTLIGSVDLSEPDQPLDSAGANVYTTFFSTPDGYMNGIAVDSGAHLAYFSVWNGFAVFDMVGRKFTKTILVNPTENFGFDSVHQRIYAPFYACTSNGEGHAPPTCDTTRTPDGGAPMEQGLSVVDLTDGAVYVYQDPTAENPDAPFGGEPDSAAIDPTTQTLIIPDELTGNQHIVDMSKAVFDKATHTVTAPHQVLPNADYTGVAIESNRHLGFWEQEFSDTVGFMATTAIDPDAGATAFFRGRMPDKPGVDGGIAPTSWSNVGDPHGIAVTTGILDSKSVGFVIDSGGQWVARVDLEKWQSLPHAVPGEFTADELAPAVTYLDGTTAVP